ncbi:PREDICTED: nardilysin-like [Trachymyrmex cornetzi]|uniref:nardilysin-like n=1 Tax=Trachymyrmex cornetzi TaxID=471704 RepID=UPI00084F6EA3|nr:PREDICTED: nardilysin-like [Trachymyrmex cornetzi]
MQATNVVIEDWFSPITISAIYCPPKHATKQEDFENYFETLGNRFISGGDFNAKHPLWGSRLMSPKGRELHKAMENLNLEPASKGEPTYWPTDRRKIPDVIDFYVIKNINKRYLKVQSCLELSSDHSPVLLTVRSEVLKKEKPCVLSNGRTDWTYFREQIEKTLNISISLKTEDEINEAVEHFNHSIQQAAWEATPFNYSKEKVKEWSDLTKQKVAEKRRLRKQCQLTRSPEMKTKLNKAEYSTTNLHQIHAGVPQGSVLEPLLYLLYTADLPTTSGVMTATFADDTVALASHVNHETASDILQNNLNNIQNWLVKWRIKPNEIILKPVWTYGIQLWGTAANSNIEILQRFQSKVLRMIVNAPWFITNDTIQSDLQVLSVKEEITKLTKSYQARLKRHSNIYAVNLTNKSRTLQRPLLISDINLKTDDSRDEDDEIDEKKAACGLCVEVGCFSDPDIKGVANLLKRMVFMRSEKYTQDDSFESFIEKYGGSVGVLTDSEQTTFYFAIQEEHLFPALDRFAQGFIKPLMTKDIITRERENIIHEYELVHCDESKEQALSSAQTDPVNKYIRDSSMMFINNMDDNKLYEELHKFRNRYYSAHRMTIAIQAKLSLSTLEKFVAKCFVDVPSNRLSPDYYIPSVSFDSLEIAKVLIETRPHLSHVMVKQGDEVEVTWTMHLPLSFYNSKPYEYLAWIIRHRGKGSLTSYLRNKMPSCISLDDNVQCSSETSMTYNCICTIFKITVKLFCEEQEHLKQVLDTIFSFINLLKKDDPHKRTIYYDIYKIMKYNFRFIDEKDSVDYIVSLCKGMHFYPPRDYITANELICIKYNPEDIQKCLNYLKPETAIITILQKKPLPLTIDHNEVQSHVNWDGKKHIYIEVSKEYIEHWKSIEPLSNFHLPLKNVFIASDFSLISIPEKVSKYPVKIYNDHISEIWYCPNLKFRLPKCYVNFQFVSTIGVQSPKNAVIMEMYCHALKLLLFEELYPAVVAGFEYHVHTSYKGIIIEINGFSEKLPLLLRTIAKCMVDCPALVTESLFECCKVRLLDEGYYSKAFMNPFVFINDVKLSILKLIHYTYVDMHTALSSVNFKEFRCFVKSFTDHLYIQCLVQGNITPDDALVTIRECLEIVNCGPLLSNTLHQMIVMQIPLGISCCKLKSFNKTDQTSMVTNYYQVGITSFKLSVLLHMMTEVMNEMICVWIVDKKLQFKIILCDYDNINGVLGYFITVYADANKYTTEHIDQQIEAFLQFFHENLKDSHETNLDDFKKIAEKTNRYFDNAFSEEVNRNWSEIITGKYVFDRYEREMLVMKDIKINDLKECFAKHTENGSNFRKLSIHVVGNDPENIAVEKENKHFTLEYINDDQQETGNHRIVDVKDYKKYLYTYPLKAKNN